MHKKQKFQTTSFGFCFRPSTRPEAPGRIYLRVIHGSQSRSATTPHRVFPAEWDPERRRLKIPRSASPRTSELLEIEQSMVADMLTLERLTASLHAAGSFSAAELIDRYRDAAAGNSLAVFAARLAEKLAQKGASRTAAAYRTTTARFLKFVGNNSPNFEQISAPMILKFQNSLKAEGRSQNTISFYLRTLRAIYQKAAAEDRAPRNAEIIFAGARTEIAAAPKATLTSSELALLQALDPTLDSVASPKAGIETETKTGTEPKSLKLQKLPENLAQALAIFLFCFHARGMDFSEMAFLKKSDIRGGLISYRRHKNWRQMEVAMVPVMRRIVEWFAPRTQGSEYIFPIITSPTQSVDTQYNSGLRLQNQRLKKLASICRIVGSLTTGSARRIWASQAQLRGLPPGLISQAQGQQNPQNQQISAPPTENQTPGRTGTVRPIKARFMAEN